MNDYTYYLEQIYTERNYSNTIHVFDIDDTLMASASQIRYKEPEDIEWSSVGTDEFAEVRQELHPDTEFDFSDFRKYRKMFQGLVSGSPRMDVLAVLDKAILNNDHIGLLTARGNQSAVFEAMKRFLLYKDERGNLQPLPKGALKKKFVWATSDDRLQGHMKEKFNLGGDANDPSVLKAKILQHYFGDQFGFQKIIFYDDDQGNIDMVERINDPRIQAILV